MCVSEALPNWAVLVREDFATAECMCVCSPLTNMLSCGFVFVSTGLIAASSVCLNVCSSVHPCEGLHKKAPSTWLI